MIDLENKEKRLRQRVKSFNQVLVAFSGGVDSTLLAKIAADELGENALAVTISSEVFPEKDLQLAASLAHEIGIRHRLVALNKLHDPAFAQNSRDRCFFCKMGMFEKLHQLSAEEGKKIIDGATASDLMDFRPGVQAGDRMGIKHPLAEEGFTKKEVRALSKKLGLSNFSRPAMACLASRIPYGEKITVDKLRRIEEGERFLSSLGLTAFRLRIHGKNLARIEVIPEEFKMVLDNKKEIVAKLKKLGFIYISFDLEGFRSGSANEALENNGEK